MQPVRVGVEILAAFHDEFPDHFGWRDPERSPLHRPVGGHDATERGSRGRADGRVQPELARGGRAVSPIWPPRCSTIKGWTARPEGTRPKRPGLRSGRREMGPRRGGRVPPGCCPPAWPVGNACRLRTGTRAGSTQGYPPAPTKTHAPPLIGPRSDPSPRRERRLEHGLCRGRRDVGAFARVFHQDCDDDARRLDGGEADEPRVGDGSVVDLSRTRLPGNPDPRISARTPDPCCTTFSSIVALVVAVAWEMASATDGADADRARPVRIADARTRYGSAISPWFATALATSAICSGVACTSPWPKPVVASSTLFHGPPLRRTWLVTVGRSNGIGESKPNASASLVRRCGPSCTANRAYVAFEDSASAVWSVIVGGIWAFSHEMWKPSITQSPAHVKVDWDRDTGIENRGVGDDLEGRSGRIQPLGRTIQQRLSGIGGGFCQSALTLLGSKLGLLTNASTAPSEGRATMMPRVECQAPRLPRSVSTARW